MSWPRFYPANEAGALVEVTGRTIGARSLLVPAPEPKRFNEIVVESPYDWPGVHSAKALVTGEKLEGVWFNRTKEWAARQCGREYGYYDFATRYRLGFAPLPAFRGLGEEEYQAKVADLWDEFRAFLTGYLVASEMLRSGKSQPAEASLFPHGCYPQALPFTGSPAPSRPPVPPTRRLVRDGREVVERGPIPVVEPPVRIRWGEPQPRGHPV